MCLHPVACLQHGWANPHPHWLQHGGPHPAGERDIQKAKSKLQVQRDLDGIDSSNIIQGGRGRRAAAPVSYKGMVQPPSDSEEEEESSSEEEEEVALSGSDAEAGGSTHSRLCWQHSSLVRQFCCQKHCN